MDGGRLALRLMALLLVAVVPVLVVFAVVMFLAGDWVEQAGLGSALLLVTLAALIWVGILTVAGSRRLGDDLRTMVRLAERGRRTVEADTVAGGGEAQRRMAAALDERNRQIASLASEVRQVAIGSDAAEVARSVVNAARAATGDATWSLAVLRVAESVALEPGVYAPERDEPAALEEIHRWASVAAPDADPGDVRHVEGPWGGFLVIDLASGEDVGAMLLAPWEGRAEPSMADRNLYSLLGQHVGNALEHALLYARVRSQADELHRLAEVQRDFLRGVTHDLQTPLTSIRAIAEEFGARTDLDPAGRADLDVIQHQADRLRRMVGQLLAVTRLDAGALVARQEVFSAEPIVRRTWRALVSDTRELKLESDEPLIVADPDRVEQIVWALLDNALKYGRGGEISVGIASHPRKREDPRLRSDAVSSDLVAELWVSDPGFGMDAEALSHAFEQFYRSAAARAAAPDGSGIGLYAAKGLARIMGGSMTVESTEGVGTTFRVFLPAEPREAEGESVNESAADID